MKQFIDQLTAWITLAALLTGCATPGNTPAPVTPSAAGSAGGNSVLDIIAALERDTAERRIPQAEGMVAVPAEMRSAIQGLLASPEGSGADNLKLRYAKPYMIEEEQAVLERAPAPRPYPPRPPLRRESGWAWYSDHIWVDILFFYPLGLLFIIFGIVTAVDPPEVWREQKLTRLELLGYSGLFIVAGGGIIAPTFAWSGIESRSLGRNIERNRRVTREWEAQKREIDAENGADRSAVDARNRERQGAVDARNRDRQAVLDASINRYRGYIEVVDRENGTVRIIWPDLISPEPRAAGQ